MTAPRSPYDPALQALWQARQKKLPVWWEADTRDEIHRALDLAAEFGTTAVIVGGREAAKVADRLKAEHVAVVLRLSFPEEPKVPTEEEYRRRPALEQDDSLKLLAHRKEIWAEQVATAAALAKAGVPFAFATEGLDRLDRFPAQMRALIAAGLSADSALVALTQQAAVIAGLERRLGTLEPGKLGHVVAFSAAFQNEQARARYVLIDGLKFEIKPPEPGSDDGRPGARRGQGPRGEGRGNPPARGASPAAGPVASGPGTGHTAGTPARPELAKQPGDKPGSGSAVQAAKEPAPKPEPASAPKQGEPKKDAKPQPPAGEAPKATKPEAKPEVKPAPLVDVAGEFDKDRTPKLKTGGNVLIKDAAILTVTQGTIPRGSILIEKGIIKAVGPDVKAKPGVTVIEGAGLVAMPGIIDTHSHIAIQGGVNEFSLSVVPEVRVKDVVTGDDVSIYRALAGGTTTARLLHGSANTIGGQDAVIKLRYGKPGRDLIIRDAPQGVKFALGENVTRSRGRFPEYPHGRRGRHRACLRGSQGLPCPVAGLRRGQEEKRQPRPALPRAPTFDSRRWPASSMARSRFTAIATAVMKS